MSKIGPEAALQTMVNKFVRAHVPQPHFFTGIDRAQQTGFFTHARQKSRGILAGVPDTLLLVPHLPAITIELKAKGKTLAPNSSQQQVGKAIQAAGAFWGWCDSVAGFAALLQVAGVALEGRWDLAAAGHDATLAAAVIEREEAGGTVSKKRYRRPEPKPSAAKLRKVAAFRAALIRI